MHEIPRWRRVIRAAGRLAALYVGTAFILLLVAVMLLDGILPSLGELLQLWVPVAGAFLIAFLVLAAARRAGLVLLWAILMGLWALMMREAPHPWITKQFVAWSVLALPLYGLGMIGAPTTHRLVRKSSWGIGVIWLGLIVAVFAGPWEILLRNAAWIWGAFPFLVGVHELVRVWHATGKIASVSSGVEPLT